MTTLHKTCPVCNNDNEDSATYCKHCGASLEEIPTQVVSLPDAFGKQATPQFESAESIIDVAAIPQDGLGICVVGESKPFYIHIYKELIIGRGTDATLKAVLDLTEFNAINLGVSRRHCSIRRTTTGFELLDLASRNGTWLNSERLIPNKPYVLTSGSKIRIGQISLIVIFNVKE